MPSYDDCTASYIAGLIDGEGCITAVVTRPRARELSFGINGQLRVQMTDETLIRWLCETTAEGSVTFFDRRNNRSRVQWCWRTSIQQAARVLHHIRPYLRLKSRQADLLCELASIRSHSRRLYRHNAKRQYEIVNELHALNQRGVVPHSEV